MTRNWKEIKINKTHSFTENENFGFPFFQILFLWNENEQGA